MNIPLRVLIIEDSDRDVALEVRVLKAAGYEVTFAVVETAAEMKAALIEQAFDIVISDHGLPQFDAPGALAVLKENGLDLPFIIVSGAIGEETAVALMKAGAHDYIMKDRISRLAPAVQRELLGAKLRREKKRMEDQLAESEIRYRRLFETASDGIVLLEKKQGQVAHSNPAVENMLGYSKAEILGKKLQDIGVSIDTRDFSAIMQELDREGILNYEDIQVKTRAGQEIYTDIYMVDRTILAQCNIRDVSERKLAEKMLTEEKNFIENALNTLTDVFFVFSLSGKFFRWNKALNAVTGYLDTEIKLMKSLDLFRGDDIRRIAAAIQTAINEGSVEVNALLVSKDGKQIPYAFSASLLRDTSGNPMAICGIGRDISERIQAERDLHSAFIEAQEGETRWEAIMFSMGDGISIQDPDYIITYQNQALKDLIGEHVGEHCYTAYEQKDHICEGCPVEMAYNDGGIHKAERTVTVGKETRYREVTASPLRNVDGNIVSVVEVIRDFTNYKKLEAQLRQAQKMEAIGTLAGGIAHDFNNILSVIMGFGTIIMDALDSGSPVKEDMNEVLSAADKAVELTKRLLLFSRKQVAEVKCVNINELIRDLQKMLRRMVNESIAFHLNLAEMPLIAETDPGLIEQVLVNLCVNAKDAMPEGGTLTISTEVEKIVGNDGAEYGFGRPGTYALIKVGDTGQGMDAEIQKQIFEPFFTTKAAGEGTGLGLAMCYGIITQHNGYIHVYSEPGHGTEFKIYLPLREKAVSVKQKIAVAVPVKGGHETVLVAEDDPSLMKLATKMLESFGYTVITAENGEDAITKFMENRERIDLLLLDMIMPKKNGKEVADAVRKINPEIKVLFASGYTMDILKTKDLTESGFDFIHKPYQSKNLLMKVRDVLDK